MTTPRRALVVLDVQQEYFFGPLRIQHPVPEDSLPQILHAIDVARAHHLPVVVVRHENPAGSAVFASGSEGAELHPEVAGRGDATWHRITKRFASAFDDTDLAVWCSQHRLSTLTIVGHMANNCVLATAASAAPRGLAVEVLSDAIGTVHLSNEAGSVAAQQLHHDLMVLLQSNLAAVTTVEEWAHAVATGVTSPKSNLVASAGRWAPSGTS
ncbi:MAG: isochorismatase family protein [Arachnia propionica]|uniref:isochorismatase family protein n=1 Tax=Arachnia propionica TaxID=1750 RepID=UPI0027100DF9|nr:isochorismatase family protein [Arachnia propionica]